jgi:DNA-directed RNA polymerase subunit omega
VLNDLKVDELLGKVDSRYGLAVASAKRARQINEYTSTLGLNDALGIPGPQVHTRSQHPLTIAIEELRQDKLDVSFRQPVEEVEEEAGAAGGDDFISPPSGGGVPHASDVDTGAPEDEGVA